MESSNSRYAPRRAGATLASPPRGGRRSGRVAMAVVGAVGITLPLLQLSAGASVSAPPGTPAAQVFQLAVLSSPADQVSGGDALVQVTVPQTVPMAQVQITRNGDDVRDSFQPGPLPRTLVGLVGDLRVGANALRVAPNGQGQGRPAAVDLTLVDYPISGPIFSGPQQQPFVCTTARMTLDGRKLLDQPLVDNQNHFGIPVAQEDASGAYPQDSHGYPTSAATIVGWSGNCAAQSRVGYLYRSATDHNFHWLDNPASPPPGVDTATTLDGRTVPFVVRWERGTIDRFIYSVAMLAPAGAGAEANPAAPDDSLWNRRLVFAFQGGVGIGHTQGTVSSGNMLPADLLGLGYGVITSTGLSTDNHYNLQLGGETAQMLKEHFIKSHGVPDYTVSVGGSGGAIQQYVYAQNLPGLIDAAIPEYSYPDMVTQTIHVGDCELLEHFFDVTDKADPKWKDPEVRQAVIGLNASNFPKNLSAGAIAQWNGLYSLQALFGYQVMTRDPASPAPALTECEQGWFGLTPLALNPTFTNVDDIDKLAQGTAGVEWTHFGDLVNIYGTDANGYANRPWDNVGVQYGLQALVDGIITPDEFLRLNDTIGGWKASKDMGTEGFPFVGPPTPANFDPWSSRDMTLSSDGGVTPAPRTSGRIGAMNAAYTSGMVFDGNITIPVIDWRPYLEDDLNMHNSRQSFVSRQRIIDKKGNADNQVIWFTDARPSLSPASVPRFTAMAFAVIDQWMANIKAHPALGVAGNKPARAVDACFATDGTPIASGPGVWNGVLDHHPAGVCTQYFQIHSTSRVVAGAPFEGNVFKCQLQSVSSAIAKGLYGSWAPTAADQAQLQAMFPTGVCDYSKPDAGRPTG